MNIFEGMQPPGKEKPAEAAPKTQGILAKVKNFLSQGTRFLTGFTRSMFLRSRRSQRESNNPLLILTPQKARELYNEYREGRYAQVMLTWDALEEIDDVLGTVYEKRISAIKELDSSVVVDAQSIGDDKALETLAKLQQEYVAAKMATVENLSDAIGWLATADFRGFAHLEIFETDESTIRLIPIEQWLVMRPDRNGPWYYNPDADTYPINPELMDNNHLIIRECDRPIDIPSMFAIVAKVHAVDCCDGFLDIFGNPAIFFKYPAGTSDARAKEYDEMAFNLTGDGRGGYPDGGEFKVIETTARSGDIFLQRADWCNKQIVYRGTGGLLTVLAESGSGTLGGNAHQETFRMIASAVSVDISACINKQLVCKWVKAKFPGKPVLVKWTLAYEEPEDTTAKVQNICSLAQEGYRADDAEVSKIAGFTVTSANMDPTALYATKAVGFVPTQAALQERLGMPIEPALPELLGQIPTGSPDAIENREDDPELIENREITLETTEESPLTPDEWALLEKLVTLKPDPGIILKDAESLKKAVEERLKANSTEAPTEDGDPVAIPLQNANSAQSDNADDLICNGKETKCQAKDPSNCRYHHPKQKSDKSHREDWRRPQKDLTPRQNAKRATRAMDWAVNNKKDVTKVMHRDGLGWVDMPYGRTGTGKADAKGTTHADGYGLSHIEAKHGKRALRRMPLILSHGTVTPHGRDKNKLTVTYGNEVVHLRKQPRSNSSIVTSYDETKTSKSS